MKDPNQDVLYSWEPKYRRPYEILECVLLLPAKVFIGFATMVNGVCSLRATHSIAVQKELLM